MAFSSDTYGHIFDSNELLYMRDTHMEPKLKFIIKIYFIVTNCELELLFSIQAC